MKMFKHIFLKNKEGVALLEFAITLPLLLLILTATIEISSFAYMSQKNQTAANVAIGLLTNLNTLQGNEIKNITEISAKVFGDLLDDPKNDYGIVVTFVQSYPLSTDTDTPPTRIPHVIHQETYGNTHLVASTISFSRGTPESDIDDGFITNNPISDVALNNYTFIDNEQIVIVETATQYKPMVTSLISEDLIAANTIIRYKLEPTIMRIGRSNSLPDGGKARPQ